MSFFSIGIGIDISETHVRVARVSYFGRVLELWETEIPTGLVRDDKIIDTEVLHVLLRKNDFFRKQTFLHEHVGIVIPDSRVFHASVSVEKQQKDAMEDQARLLAQREIPLPFPSAYVLTAFSINQQKIQADVEAVERETIDNLIATISHNHVQLVVIEARSRALWRLAKACHVVFDALVGFIDITENWITVNLFEKERCVYSRSIRQKKEFLMSHSDFITHLLDEIVLYYQQRDVKIDRFIFSGTVLVDQVLQKQIETWTGNVKKSFFNEFISLKGVHQELKQQFVFSAAIGTALYAARSNVHHPFNFFTYDQSDKS